MDTHLIPIQTVVKFAVDRVPALPEEPERIALAFEDREGKRCALEITDAMSYSLIRTMTDTLFRAEE